MMSDKRRTADDRSSAIAVTSNDVEQRSSVPERIVENIVRLIRSGDLVPGQRLVEADFIERLGVSRGPLREAFKQLNAMGLVVLAPHRGARIRHLSRREALERVTILEVLLGLAARLAAQCIDEGDNRAIFAAAAETFSRTRGTASWSDFIVERDEFYRTLLPLTGNRELADEVERLQMHLMRSLIRTVTPEERARQYDLYDQMNDRILAGDDVRAEELMRQRMREILTLYMALPDDRFGPDPSEQTSIKNSDVA